MFVLSRVVVGLARQKKEQNRGKAFFILRIPYWTFMYLASIRQMGTVPADCRVVNQEVLG
ncbi:hypothetical protein BKX96_01225 [Pseudomonas putida]|nr:hypothetical protein BKX96_01225 [Pseudomonas putida]